MRTAPAAIGAPVSRVEGAAKVTGAARYAGEIPLEQMAYGWAAQASIARGQIDSVDAAAALAMPGVIGVLTYANAPRLLAAGDGELLVLQDNRVHYRGQVVALVVAGRLEQARAAAEALPVSYAAEPHDVTLRADHPGMYAPGHVNPGYVTDTATGDVEAALAGAAAMVDETYSTPAEHNNPMEPHAAIARWDDDSLTVWDSNQGPTRVRQALATLFGLEASAVRVITEHVGGGFGAKGTTRPHTVLAAMAARRFGLPGAGDIQQTAAVLPGGLPHADHSAGAAGRGRRRPYGSPRSPRLLSDVDRRGVRRADRRDLAGDVCLAEPAHAAPAGRPGRAHPPVDAGAGRGPARSRSNARWTS